MAILIQVLGILGIMASIWSFQCNTHKKIMIFRTINESLFAVQYVLLGAYTGAVMCVVGCVRNLIFADRVAKEKSTLIPRIVFCVIFGAAGVFSWDGLLSLLIIFAKVLSTAAYGSKRANRIRMLSFTTSTCWLVYNLFISSYTGAICEVLTLCSIISGIVRLDIYPAISKIGRMKSVS